ncbi:MAG TPA: hypothetical protein VH165_28125, partial [Kofleriaceae bacterium]|nr:hypothetical protein [Kofleriaceae bacterium]
MAAARLILGVAVALACTRAEATPTPNPVPNPPADLLVSVALGPTTTLRGLQAYLEAIKPGTGAVLTEQLVRHQLAEAAGVGSLDGLD